MVAADGVLVIGRGAWNSIDEWNTRALKARGLTDFQIEHLARLPEQTRGYPKNPRVWTLSREFTQVIDRLPYYTGVLREEGHAVHIGFMGDATGYPSHVPLRAYLIGEVYARVTDKHNPALRVPSGMEEEVIRMREKTLIGLFTELQTNEEAIHLASYPGSSVELLKALQKADDEK